MHCIILAGGDAGPDSPLYTYAQGKPKALIDMGGRTMLERVIDALQSAEKVEDILVVGIDSETATRHGLRFQRPVEFIADCGGMVANMLAGAAWYRQHKPEVETVLGCSADIPAITGNIVDRFIDACQPWDKGIYYSFVTRTIIEAQFPHSNRTYSRISGQEVAGGDMVVARLEIVERNRTFIDTLTRARKQPWRVAGVIGFGMILKLLLRRLTFEDIETTAERVLGLPAKIVLFDRPELAMDADKPYQVDILRAQFS